MGLKLKPMIGVLVLAAAAAMLAAAAVGTSVAGASEWKTTNFPVTVLGESLGGVTVFLAESLNAVTCEAGHVNTSAESSTKAKATLYDLGKCELIVEKSSLGKFKEACPNITSKEITITPLSKLNGGSQTGVLALPATGTEFANFTCTGSNKVNIKVKGGYVCESTPIGKLVISSQVICREKGKHGEQEFTSGTNPSGATVTTGLTAESGLGIFKTTEKDATKGTTDLTASSAVEQTP